MFHDKNESIESPSNNFTRSYARMVQVICVILEPMSAMVGVESN